MKENKKNTKKSGFKVPDQYFENFENQLSDAIRAATEDDFVFSKIRKPGFKVPDQYFKDFKKQLLANVSENEEEVDILKNIKETGFKVPDQYFKTFEDNLLIEIDTQKNATKVISIAVIKKLVYLSGVAAMITLAVILWNQNQTTALDFDSIAISDINEYINNGNLEISDDELAVLLDGEDDFMGAFEYIKLSSEDLEDYLLTEDLENDLYIE